MPGNSGCPLVDQKGNVIGVGVSAVFLGEAPAGLNFFVPINHALAALNIEMVAPAHLEHKRRLAAEEIKTKPKAETSHLEKEKPKVAAIPKEVQIRKVSLRKKPVEISSQTRITDMLIEYDFFDRSKNPGGSFVNSFVDNKDGTITDKATGLMWLKSGSSSSLENRRAKEYIKQINRQRFAGYSDWRMPTIEELASLLARRKKSGVHMAAVFESHQISCWSADGCDADKALKHLGFWIVDFKQGQIFQASWSEGKSGFSSWGAKNHINYVKAVRSVK